MSPRRFAWLLPVGVAALIGCNSKPASVPKAAPVVKAAPAEELADTIHETLQKSTDLAACRRLVDQLNVALSRPGKSLTPAPLSSDLKATYSRELGLTLPEIEEIGRSEFTMLDAAALEEAFLFRDLAKALDVAALPPAARADAALDWVARNVREVPNRPFAAPPGVVVMRGVGSPIERTYVLLTLLRQLDLDAAVVGDSSAEVGGMWGVAVRTDDGVYMFDARLGIPLPGNDGKPATLAQLRSDAALLKPLVDAKPPYDVAPERLQKSALFVTAPLSSLAPRMQFLQTHMAANAARISTDVLGLRDRFRKALQGPGLEGVEVRLWNTASPDAWTRVLTAFLPPGDGGSDRADPSQQRRQHYNFEQVPWGALPPYFLQLAGEPGDRIRASFAGRVLGLRQPGQAKDHLIRGLFQEATEQLIQLQTKLNTRSIATEDLEKDSRGWAETASAVYAELLRTERAAKTDPMAAAHLAEIREKIDNIWKKSMGPSQYLDVLAAPFLNDEATFLLALSKHEQAQRRGYRSPAGKAATNWETARKWWIQYLNTFPNSAAVGVARRNLAQALIGEGNREAAKAEYRALANSELLAPLERTACLILAERLK